MNSSTQTEGAKRPTVETRHDSRSGQYVPVIRWPDGHTTDQSPTSFDRDRALAIGEDVLRHMETRAVNAFPDLVAALKFYANPENWKVQENGFRVKQAKTLLDEGTMARAALLKAKA